MIPATATPYRRNVIKSLIIIFLVLFLVSWGCYWSWDPKETWALITLMVYAVPLHGRLLPAFSQPWVYHLYIVISLVSVAITYWGVNMLLGGMHSYA